MAQYDPFGRNKAACPMIEKLPCMVCSPEVQQEAIPKILEGDDVAGSLTSKPTSTCTRGKGRKRENSVSPLALSSSVFFTLFGFNLSFNVSSVLLCHGS